MEELNLNQTIKVKLTAYGHKVYLEHWNNSKIWWGVNEIDRFKNLTYPKKVDSDGFSKFQLWEFMDIFGKHISMEVPVIKDLTLYIPEQLKVSNKILIPQFKYRVYPDRQDKIIPIEFEGEKYGRNNCL